MENYVWVIVHEHYHFSANIFITTHDNSLQQLSFVLHNHQSRESEFRGTSAANISMYNSAPALLTLHEMLYPAKDPQSVFSSFYLCPFLRTARLCDVITLCRASASYTNLGVPSTRVHQSLLGDVAAELERIALLRILTKQR